MRAEFATAERSARRWSQRDLPDPRLSNSLERGLAILACFSPQRPLLGVAEIADELDMSRSTTHRYLSTLVALGYVEQGASRKYRLTLRVTSLGMSALSSTGLLEHARPYLQELCARTGFTVGLAVLEDGEVRVLDCVRGRRRGRAGDDVGAQRGALLPAYCTAAGKVLLAGLPEDERRGVLTEMTLARRTPATITSRRDLAVELDAVLDEGVAVNDEELAVELHAIAVPVRDSSREVVAAAGMVAHTSTISLGDLAHALAPHLIATADRVSARLGYRRDDELTTAA